MTLCPHCGKPIDARTTIRPRPIVNPCPYCGHELRNNQTANPSGLPGWICANCLNAWTPAALHKARQDAKTATPPDAPPEPPKTT